MSFEFKRARGKTAVFSGARNHVTGHVPKLEELCIQKLLDNVSRIECVGDVPYYILKPVLTKLSADQLRRIEAYNPQLVGEDESDEPWIALCQRHFEGRQPHKSEKWRDLFIRCEKERNHKIEKIAKKIKKHEKKAAPVRQTRVVDQLLHGNRSGRAMSSRTVITKTIVNHIPSHGSSSSNSKPSTSTVVIKREVPGSGTKNKPKTAPLMQKSMQLFKGRFRR